MNRQSSGYPFHIWFNCLHKNYIFPKKCFPNALRTRSGLWILSSYLSTKSAIQWNESIYRLICNNNQQRPGTKSIRPIVFSKSIHDESHDGFSNSWTSRHRIYDMMDGWFRSYGKVALYWIMGNFDVNKSYKFYWIRLPTSSTFQNRTGSHIILVIPSAKSHRVYKREQTCSNSILHYVLIRHFLHSCGLNIEHWTCIRVFIK